MKKRTFARSIPVLACAGLLMTALPLPSAYAADEAPKQVIEQKKETNVYKGKITGKSKKAKSIIMQTGKEPDVKTVMLKYDDATKGLDEAVEGEAAIITFEVRGKDKYAVDIKPKLAQLPEGVKETQPDDVAALVALGPEKGQYFLVDARPAKPYSEGHVPTAVSIPLPSLKKEGAPLLPANKDLHLIFYCGGLTCGLSTESAELAKKMGYTNIQVMLKGAPGWKKSGRALVASDTFVNEGNIVLVDLRQKGEVTKGHIKGAVNIPAAELADTDEDFPVKAPVVIYGNESESKQGMKALAGLGIKKVSQIEGGLAGYVARGNKLVSGEPKSEITWVRKLGKGEVSSEEFVKVASSGSEDKVILDVRTADEAASGSFNGAITIPLDTLENRLAELPKDKELLIHCSTGARAEMAQAILEKQGFKSRFLVADVECQAAGQCMVE
ncbi:MAG: rhodanese-like domain-containing protein [Desulfobulbaceae bacterium]|nr:rhodanese-like domain-containing protein [Desulfobulbaceae bacterium]